MDEIIKRLLTQFGDMELVEKFFEYDARELTRGSAKFDSGDGEI